MELRAPAGGILVVPMSREEFDALPEMPHTEWWDGACVVTGGTTYRHARVVIGMGGLLSAALRDRGLDVLAGVGWRLPDAEFAPDIAVVAPGPPDERLSSSPLLVVEVLSRSTRHIDLGRKRQLYAAGGLPWYWFVDLANNELVVLRNDAGAFVEVQRLTSGTTIGPVEIAVTVADL
jgi:Uma2 family endonuclease